MSDSNPDAHTGDTQNSWQAATLTPQAAEQLLNGHVPAAGHYRLASLLKSAAAPASPGELHGEAAAVAAFRAAQRTPAIRTPLIPRMLVLKVSAIAALVTAAGLAVASGTGILPTPFSPAPQLTSSSSPAEIRPTTPNPATVSPSEQPPAGIKGLCNSYLGKGPDGRAKALESKPFEELAKAAGGPSKVEQFCLTQAKPEKADDPAAKQHPSHSGKASQSKPR